MADAALYRNLQAADVPDAQREKLREFLESLNPAG